MKKNMMIILFTVFFAMLVWNCRRNNPFLISDSQIGELATNTATVTKTSTPQNTATATLQISASFTPTLTATLTMTSIATATRSETATSSATSTRTVTATPTGTLTRQPTPTNTMQATQAPTCISPLHYGMDSGTPRPDYWSGSFIWVMDYNLSIAGRLDSVTAQFQLAGGQAMAALYDSSGNKLTESAVTPTSAGWVTMPVGQIVLATGMYKLAIQASGGNLLALNLNSMSAYSNSFGSMPAVLPAVNHTQGTISILAYGNICP